ncbi:MAG: hypothetical protein ACREAB_10125, partial [Blastocatellia bacterium]
RCAGIAVHDEPESVFTMARKTQLAGYEIYRYGGYELQGNAGKDSAEKFFHKLLRKHGLITK